MNTYEIITCLEGTKLRDFIITRLNQGFNDYDILEEIKEFMNELMEGL